MDQLDKDTVQQVFLMEEIQRRRHAADAVSVAAMAAASALLQCDFCSCPGHTQSTCRTFARAQENTRKQATSRGTWKQCQGAKKAQETAATVPAAEFAGNASAVSDLPDPSFLIQPHTNFRWNTDTGCTSTMMPHCHWMCKYCPYHVSVKLADGSFIHSVGIGSVVIDPQPSILSVSYPVLWLRISARIMPNNAAYINRTTIPASEAACAITTRSLDLQLWHERLCHHNSADIQKLISNGLATGITLSSSVKRDPICKPCFAGKMHSSPFPSTGHCASAPLDLIHSDLCGPLSASTPLLLFKALAENQLGRKIKALHDDNGGDYMSKEFNSFCDESGILRTHMARNQPQQNGDAERANRTMLEDVTAMLAQASLPVRFWGRCLATQVKVWNCFPTASLPDRTPFEAWFGRKPDLSRFRVFGCTAYVFVQKDKRKKLESHMQKCIFVGYPPDYSTWTFYNPVTKQFIISECAEFDERVFPGLSIKETTPNAQLRLPPTLSLPNSNPPSPAALPAPAPFLDLPPPPLAVPQPAPQPPAPPVPPAAPAILRQSQREVKKPGEWWKSFCQARPTYWEPRHPSPAIADSDDSDNELGGYAEVHAAQVGGDPRTFKQAMALAQAQHWEAAAADEILTLIANGTWELVELPPGEKAIPSGWVFKTKRTSTGEVECYKGRVVAKACSQCPGIDYDGTYSPTFRAATLRTTLAAAGIEDMELRSVDISAAFTNGDLEEVIYMRQPEGFHEGGPNIVCRLKKSLYGLKQAARQWNKKLHSVLLKLGFTCLQSDRVRRK
ncbi:hypothetical protein H1R20_g683, partial [Candolleomyces eurysporus]